jgi:signal transduction histidine kinase
MPAPLPRQRRPPAAHAADAVARQDRGCAGEPALKAELVSDVRRLTSLVSAMLDLARLQNHAIEKRADRPLRVALEVLADFSPSAAGLRDRACAGAGRGRPLRRPGRRGCDFAARIRQTLVGKRVDPRQPMARQRNTANLGRGSHFRSTRARRTPLAGAEHKII